MKVHHEKSFLGHIFQNNENNKKQIAIITKGKPIALLVASSKINIPTYPNN